MKQNIRAFSFVNGERNLLLDFLVWWDAKHTHDPENYPLKMCYGDWLEQFNLWVETERKELLE